MTAQCLDSSLIHHWVIIDSSDSRYFSMLLWWSLGRERNWRVHLELAISPPEDLVSKCRPKKLNTSTHLSAVCYTLHARKTLHMRSQFMPSQNASKRSPGWLCLNRLARRWKWQQKQIDTIKYTKISALDMKRNVDEAGSSQLWDSSAPGHSKGCSRICRTARGGCATPRGTKPYPSWPNCFVSGSWESWESWRQLSLFD